LPTFSFKKSIYYQVFKEQLRRRLCPAYPASAFSAIQLSAIVGVKVGIALLCFPIKAFLEIFFAKMNFSQRAASGVPIQPLELGKHPKMWRKSRYRARRSSFTLPVSE
jgi:hypothetical protein